MGENGTEKYILGTLANQLAAKKKADMNRGKEGIQFSISISILDSNSNSNSSLQIHNINNVHSGHEI